MAKIGQMIAFWVYTLVAIGFFVATGIVVIQFGRVDGFLLILFGFKAAADAGQVLNKIRCP